jgi:hypothetical protein
METLKFYADAPNGEKNKQFTWKVNSILDVKARLEYFIKKGYDIRAAWYEYTDPETKQRENHRIDMVQFYTDMHDKQEPEVLFTKE